MTDLLPGTKLRAIAALIAAYAIALQAAFTMLAPMQVQADGSVTVYCSGNGEIPGTDSPAAPGRAGKLQCVLCGACASGLAALPEEITPATLMLGQGADLGIASSQDRLAESHLHDGPARAPPLTV